MDPLIHMLKREGWAHILMSEDHIIHRRKEKKKFGERRTQAMMKSKETKETTFILLLLFNHCQWWECQALDLSPTV